MYVSKLIINLIWRECSIGLGEMMICTLTAGSSLRFFKGLPEPEEAIKISMAVVFKNLISLFASPAFLCI